MSLHCSIDLARKGDEWAVGHARQTATAAAILDRFESGKKVQFLADEVGMGKTYVALAVAISRLLTTPATSDKKPRARVLVLTPNSELERKWVREIEEFRGKLMDADDAARIAIVGRGVGDREWRT